MTSSGGSPSQSCLAGRKEEAVSDLGWAWANGWWRETAIDEHRRRQHQREEATEGFASRKLYPQVVVHPGATDAYGVAWAIDDDPDAA